MSQRLPAMPELTTPVRAKPAALSLSSSWLGRRLDASTVDLSPSVIESPNITTTLAFSALAVSTTVSP
jgi:hypothetical protein